MTTGKITSECFDLLVANLQHKLFGQIYLFQICYQIAETIYLNNFGFDFIFGDFVWFIFFKANKIKNFSAEFIGGNSV